MVTAARFSPIASRASALAISTRKATWAAPTVPDLATTRDTRITFLEGPFTGQKGWVNSIAFQQATGSEDRAFCYQTTLESGKWINVKWDHVAPDWLNDDDLAWLLERLPRLPLLSLP
jgi:hypothetical protein